MFAHSGVGQERSLPGTGGPRGVQHLVLPVFEALALTGEERVLEIGSATGYLTALLSHLAAQVYCVTSEPALAEERKRDLEALGCGNVQVIHGVLGAGWPRMLAGSTRSPSIYPWTRQRQT